MDLNKQNTVDSVRFYKKKFLAEGLYSYSEGINPNNNAEVVYLKKNTIDKALDTIKEKPLVITHESKEQIGKVVDAYYNSDTARYIVSFITDNKEAIDLLDNKQYGVSCTYTINESNNTGGLHNDIEYNTEATEIEFINLAIVEHPRFEEAKEYVNGSDSFNEGEHKRDNDGKFATTGSSKEQKKEPIDLTEQFKELKGKSREEKIKIIDSELQKLIGSEIETKDNKIVGVKEPEAKHIEDKALSYKQKNKIQAQSTSAIMNLEAIIKDSEFAESRDVDSSHNTNPDTIKLKEQLSNHNIFKTKIVLDGDNMEVILTTNKYKSDKDNNKQYLYEVYIKKTGSQLANTKRSEPVSDTTIPNSTIKVNSSSKTQELLDRLHALRETIQSRRKCNESDRYREKLVKLRDLVVMYKKEVL